MITRIKLLLIAIMLLFASNVSGKREAALWTAIRDMGIMYKVGQRDSAYTQAYRLLETARKNDDDFAQAVLHDFIGICLDDHGDKLGARKEYEMCVAISEQHHYLEHARRTGLKLYFQTMLNAYGQLVLSYNANGKSPQSLRYAKTGMEWVAECKDAAVRVPALSVFADELMAHKEYSLIYEPMKHGVQDALRLGKTDFALKMSAHLVTIEREGMGRETKDIPWVRVGEELVDKAKTEDAKTAFLAAVNLEDKKDLKNSSQSLPNTLSKQQGQALRNNRIVPAMETAVKDSIRQRVEYIKVRNERIGIAITVIIVISVIFLLYALWQRKRRKHDAALAEQANYESYRDGQETERGRLARELHDGVSNQLLAVEMKLNENGLTPQTIQLLSESREQVRWVSHELIPPEFEHITLDEALGNYANELNGLNGCQVSFSALPMDADWKVIPKSTALEIYRIVQESVGNSLQHSGATIISVGMRMDESQTLTVIVSDDGEKAVDRKSSSGIGKRTINQRSSAINGKIEFFHHSLGNVIRLTVNLKGTH